MPTYVYACTNPECKHQFEAVQTFTDDALTECPVCGNRLRKVFGSVGVVFKGPGFYRTDSRSGSNGSSTVAAESSSSDSKSSDTKTSESKSSEAKSSEAKSTDTKSAASTSSSSSNGKSSDSKSSSSSNSKVSTSS